MPDNPTLVEPASRAMFPSYVGRAKATAFDRPPLICSKARSASLEHFSKLTNLSWIKFFLDYFAVVVSKTGES